MLLCESCLKLRGGEDWTSSKFHVTCVMCSVCAPLEVLLFYILLFTFFIFVLRNNKQVCFTASSFDIWFPSIGFIRIYYF